MPLLFCFARAFFHARHWSALHLILTKSVWLGLGFVSFSSSLLFPRSGVLMVLPREDESLNGPLEFDRIIRNLRDPPFHLTLPGSPILVPFPVESLLGGIRNLTDGVN
jgi:hypothetical protein